jgi:hypothetical protein
MAINLSGFLGGLGEGFGQYTKERQIKEQTKFERDSELERQRLARLADQRGQEAIDRQARAEDRLTAQSEYNQGLGIFNQIQEIARADADDDVTTGRFLRTPGLDEASRQQEVNARLQRYNQRQGLIKTLSGQGKVTQTFGDVSGLLRPTQFGTPDFKMPKPMIAPEQLRTMTDAELAKIYKAPAGQKADAVAQARQRLGYYADDSFLDSNVPKLGTSMGFGTARQPARKLESPDTFFQQNPMFTPGVGGERVLPTGSKQVVKYVDGQPMVEYVPELKANYVTPEAESLRASKLRADVDILTRSADAKVNQEFLKAEGLRWKNLLSAKAYEWFDPTQRAKINKMTSSGSKASDALRRMSIMLAHQDRQAALGLRREEFELDKLKQFNDASLDFDKSIQALEEQRRNLVVKSGTATDFAQGGTRAAAIAGIKELDAQIAALRSQGQAVKQKDLNAANQVLGGQFAPAATLDPTTMFADAQTRQQQALLAAQMGMTRPQTQQVMQPTQAAPSINFSPTIVTGGGQPAPFVGGPQPGTGGAGAGGGGMLGGGGITPPGFIGGQGGPQVPGADPAKPTVQTPNAAPQDYNKTLKGLQGQFPNVKLETLQTAAAQIASNPNTAASQKAVLKLTNDARAAENKKFANALDGFEFMKGMPANTKYALNGRAYNGPVTVFSDGSAVPYDRQELTRRRKAGLKIEKLTTLAAATPRELTPKERREQASAQRARK